MEDRKAEKLNFLINDYLKKYDCCIEEEKPVWRIEKSCLGGFGVFATEDIQPGQIIFIDFPVLLGPRCIDNVAVQCSLCYSKHNVIKCEANCGIYVCNDCASSYKHLKECELLKQRKNGKDLKQNTEKLTKCLTPLRSLLLDKEDLVIVTSLKSHKGSQHGREVDILTEDLKIQLSKDEKDFLYFVCTVLDANAFEVQIKDEDNDNTLKGLYPLGSLANHRCYPNAFHVFDEKHRMVTRASVFIPKNSEIFHSYTRLLWGTISRNHHLKSTKHFVCKCDRCLDPSEFGTYLTAINCKKCPGKLLPIKSMSQSPWKCETCMSVEPIKDVAKVLRLVGCILKAFNRSDFQLIYNFLTKKLNSLMPQENQVALELKYKIVWILGYTPGFLWHELTDELLLVKKLYCETILETLDKLRVGKCTIKGLISYELYKCLMEMRSRENNNNQRFEEEANIYLEEAKDILRYSVTSTNLYQEV